MKDFLAALCAICALSATAQNEATDSLTTHDLQEVVVEAKMQNTSANVSTYIPGANQKNAAQSGVDLLNRMGIPQLRVATGLSESVTTNDGQSVDIFIDFLAASADDLKAMRMSDVKKIEYYDYPSDPRFHGKKHVVNFVMRKYEYGGYVKLYGHEFFIANSGQLNAYSKLQYKKMTYDIAVGGFYLNQSHYYNDESSIYRLPQSDGSIQTIQREYTTTNATTKRYCYWPTFKVLYQSDSITLRNTIGCDFDNYPKRNSEGVVTYNPAILE